MTMLILTGFMGVGKTTVGRTVAERCGLPFVDLDVEIEARAGGTVAEIFGRSGQAAFRRLESAVLEEVLRGDEGVVATGGGALLSVENRALLGRRHRVVCLAASSDALRHRLEGTIDRPLLRDGGSIDTLLRERAPVYGLYPQVDTTGRSPDDIAAEVIASTGLDAIAEVEMTRPLRTTAALRYGGLVDLPAALQRRGLTGPVVLVTDSNVEAAGHATALRDALAMAGVRTINATIPAGEEHKTLSTISTLFDRCIAAHPPLDRSTVVVALGGGVVCDLAGMLAATYVRGLRFVAAPTTLLAQVDAALGGKVGVDVGSVKNLAGAFYPAELVLLDPSVLRTLPVPALSDGMAEVIKIALVRSILLLHMLDNVRSAVGLWDHPSVIRRAAYEKLQVVERDPFERHERMMLNFGHTVGHAIETVSEYRLSHGQSVSVGMAVETRMAVEDGLCPPEVEDVLHSLLDRFELPHAIPAELARRQDEIMAVMRHDKKRADGALRFALPTGVGSGEVFTLPEERVLRALHGSYRGDE
jgi:3-dehydroquinate synthase